MRLSQRVLSSSLLLVSCLLAIVGARRAEAADDAAVAAVRKNAEQLATAFNAGKADAVVAVFLPSGELIDEAGTIYQGSQEIKALLTAFFGRFPGAKLSLDIESIRLVGPIAIEEGTRRMTTADGAVKAQFRYIAVWAKAGDDWRLASFRDFNDDPAPTAHDKLQSIDWLLGDWINEGADGRVAISYRWSDDKNYLLGEFQIEPKAGRSRTSTQRIGWDPAVGRLRSWLFDTDGGFAEGTWTVVDDGVVIKSSSVNPDGTTANVTMNFIVLDKDHFTIEGTDRIIGDSLEDDFAITVTRRPPTPGK